MKNQNRPAFYTMASRWLLAMLLVLPALPSQADLILTSPPRESAEAGNQLYGPVAAHLSALLGENVRYEHPGNWLAYQRDLRDDKYDIVFDGPHFVSWRMKNRQHVPAVKLPGTLEFVIVAKAGDEGIQKLDDLIGRKVCGIPPPNLATLTVYAAFKNPARQPVIVPVRGSFDKVYQAFHDNQCDAAVFRNTYYDKKLTDEQRKGTKLLHRSEALPNQAFSVSKRVSNEKRAMIVSSLTKGDGVAVTQEIVKRFGGKAKSFIPATEPEYKEHYRLIEGVIFGW